MKLAFVGGPSRLAWSILEDAMALGVEVEWHTGDVRGRGGEQLAAIALRVDVIVVFTGINSHGGVQLAKRIARDHGVSLRMVRSAGRSVVRQILQEMALRKSAAGKNAADKNEVAA